MVKVFGTNLLSKHFFFSFPPRLLANDMPGKDVHKDRLPEEKIQELGNVLNFLLNFANPHASSLILSNYKSRISPSMYLANFPSKGIRSIPSLMGEKRSSWNLQI